MIKLGLDSFSYNLTMEDPVSPRDVFWFLRRVVELDLQGCQIDPRHIHSWDEQTMFAIRDFCGEHSLYLELGTWRYDYDTVGMQLDMAKKAGARSLRTFYGGLRHEMTGDDIRRGIAESIEGLKRLSDISEQAGVPLALENHEEFTSGEIIEILQAVDSPFVRACLDTGNCLPVGEDPIECVTNLAPYAACTHLKDWIIWWEDGTPRWEDRPLGQGEAKVVEVVALLQQLRPDLPLTIENPTWGSCRTVTKYDEERNVIQSVEYARDIVSMMQRTIV